jgi:flavin reductase (DIM6/NTAB) family NADH-FMN oxidoreductase RutF
MLTTGDQDAVRDIFRRVVREVWVVTAAYQGRRGGSTVTWLSAASIDAALPTVLVGLAPNHHTAELVEASGEFAAHLLREDQVELAWRFASSSGRDHDKLAGLECEPAAGGPPRLKDCVARVTCRVYDRKPTGDRTYFWADVTEVRELAGGRPLTDHALIAGLPDDRRRVLGEQLRADVALQRPWQAEWRTRLSEVDRSPELGR